MERSQYFFGATDSEYAFESSKKVNAAYQLDSCTLIFSEKRQLGYSDTNSSELTSKEQH